MDYVLGLHLGVRMPSRGTYLRTLRWLENGTFSAIERAWIAGGGREEG